MEQHIRPHDRRSLPLLRYLYALRLRRHAEELPPVRVPFCELWRADYTRISIPTVLEVSRRFLCLVGDRRAWEHRRAQGGYAAQSGDTSASRICQIRGKDGC